ncbi:MAG TPA: CDP-alcohol phosphatidyltransferase family protein [Candidatus Paceibacterota bacterium]|jgi:phosphatidylglycerophosphate synthase|nr:CDP-alcohol phosphatidyltransferase family protein [Candidatus Paceibacterota bacterium]
MKNKLEKSLLFFYEKYGITPNVLTYTRIFAAPWLALFVSYSISSKSHVLVIFTLVFYVLIIGTDFLDGILARHISKTEVHDHIWGAMLDRLSDKILIIFMLIPFGLNFLSVSIIAGESFLAYQAISSPSDKKRATKAGKLKMFFQALLIPILILWKTTHFVSDWIAYIFIITTILLTYISVYSHFFKND